MIADLFARFVAWFSWDLHFLYPLSIAGGVGKLALGVYLFRSRRHHNATALTWWANLSGVASILMCAAPFVWATGYWDLWRDTRALNLVLETAMGCECFWMLFAEVPNFRWVGRSICALFLLVSAVFAYVLRDFATGEWSSAVRSSALLVRNYSLGAMAFIALSWLLSLAIPQRHVSTCAKKNMKILLVFFIGSFGSMGIWDASNNARVIEYVTSQAFGRFVVIGCCLAWARLARNANRRGTKSDMPVRLSRAA